MRIISYVRTEFHGDDENVENTLLAFVYDIPYMGVCGIFPPLHILNQIFEDGGGEGGMSPGPIWEPFNITKQEYDDLAIAISSTPPDMLIAESRYNDIQFEFDAEFDNIQDWADWTWVRCVVSTAKPIDKRLNNTKKALNQTIHKDSQERAALVLVNFGVKLSFVKSSNPAHL